MSDCLSNLRPICDCHEDSFGFATSSVSPRYWRQDTFAADFFAFGPAARDPCDLVCSARKRRDSDQADDASIQDLYADRMEGVTTAFLALLRRVANEPVRSASIFP